MTTFRNVNDFSISGIPDETRILDLESRLIPGRRLCCIDDDI